MSARDWRAAREGDTHAAPRKHPKTPESLIVGVGASGALLAGAAIVFVTLVGLVSFNVWPSANPILSTGSVELSPANPGGGEGPSSPVSEASGELASAEVPAGATSPEGGGAEDGGPNEPGNGGTRRPPAAPGQPVTPPATASPPVGSPDQGPPGQSRDGVGGGGKDHPVHSQHPGRGGGLGKGGSGNGGSGNGGSGNGGSGKSGSGKGKWGKAAITVGSDTASEDDHLGRGRAHEHPKD